jgi:HTH-type transcriptional regulator/antitoxin HigA
MCSVRENAFRPDYAVPLGESLLELLELRGVSWTELAEQAGLPLETLEGIRNGNTPVTAEIARRLEQVILVPARFWESLRRHYEEAKTCLG